MTSMELVGLNTKWYRYKNNLTQEQYANRTKFKMAYISVIETVNANLTCKNIDSIAKSFNIKPILLFNEETAKMAKKLPVRVDMYRNILYKIRYNYKIIFILIIVSYLLYFITILKFIQNIFQRFFIIIVFKYIIIIKFAVTYSCY